MPRTDCKQADIWAAALDAGELDEPSRLRLMEHLDDCQACRERAQGLSALAGLLRDEPAIFPRHRATAIWRNVEAAAMAAQANARSKRIEQSHRLIILLPKTG